MRGQNKIYITPYTIFFTSFLMSRLPVNSFSTLDLTHFIETGEHLTPIKGDACPMPLEYYINQTREKQSRSRLWVHFNDRLTSNELTEVKPGIIERKKYNKAQRSNECINLYFDDVLILVLTENGILPESYSPKEPSPKAPILKMPDWFHEKN
jgi:hypothetical protein